jgi:hypothetical protein
MKQTAYEPLFTAFLFLSIFGINPPVVFTVSQPQQLFLFAKVRIDEANWK